MKIPIDVWLRGTDFATTKSIDDVVREPREWTESDVRHVLEGMLKTMYGLKHSPAPELAITLRGLSWIVNPYEEGGVVIAIEITLGAAVAGPFDIDKAVLESMISRVLKPAVSPGSVH
jgi:hypothetical protein